MKRLNTRINALESRTSDDLSHSDRMLLVSLLAKRDAMFWPWRLTFDCTTPYAEIRDRQREYISGVSGIAIKADGKSEWKTAHATRQRLIASGMITATHSSGQVSSVFLTPRGEAVARALVGPRLQTCETAKRVFIMLVLKMKTTENPIVRESVLFERTCNGNPSDWDADTEQVLPFLTSGVVLAVPDTVGRVLYRPVEGIEFPESIEVDIESSEEFDNLYLKTFEDERQMLEHVEPRDSNEIFIPCPACGSVAPHYDFIEESKP
jgi:hypothetical protein